MAFDANRDIRIEASEDAPGVYRLRTRGLEGRRRPELEIAGVPSAGLNAAGGVINILAAYTVDKAEVMADQSVGNVLTIGDEGRKLLLAVRAVSIEKPRGGLWSKLKGGGKGVLRLVDVDAKVGAPGAPLTALATMLVHRAAVRLAKDDDEGARAELDAAIEVFPGQPDAGPAPEIGGADGELNWQNHLAYLDLAALADRAGERAEAAAFFGDALQRSSQLAQRELGAPVDVLTSLDLATVEREAAAIIEHNLAALHRGPGPTPATLTLASPIWQVAGEGEKATSSRGGCLMPSSLLSLYYEGPAAEGLRRSGPSLVRKILAATDNEPWRAAWVARETRKAWLDEGPRVDAIGPAHPCHGLVSSILADVARCFRAGATEDEILTRYVGDVASARASLEEKLGQLAVWEGEQYAEAMSLE